VVEVVEPAYRAALPMPDRAAVVVAELVEPAVTTRATQGLEGAPVVEAAE
jgi:hypothetical protein